MCSKIAGQFAKDVDNLVDTIFQGLQEQRRWKITNELRRFIEVENVLPVKIGDPEKNSVAIKGSSPGSTETYKKAAVREGVDGSTL